ncbi:MAG: hypothetical protein Q8K75_04145 [Chlamydiales bacterium]|nr:hypothetical protein [Chlamydiales bacterium]
MNSLTTSDGFILLNNSTLTPSSSDSAPLATFAGAEHTDNLFQNVDLSASYYSPESLAAAPTQNSDLFASAVWVENNNSNDLGASALMGEFHNVVEDTEQSVESLAAEFEDIRPTNPYVQGIKNFLGIGIVSPHANTQPETISMFPTAEDLKTVVNGVGSLLHIDSTAKAANQYVDRMSQVWDNNVVTPLHAVAGAVATSVKEAYNTSRREEFGLSPEEQIAAQYELEQGRIDRPTAQRAMELASTAAQYAGPVAAAAGWCLGFPFLGSIAGALGAGYYMAGEISSETNKAVNTAGLALVGGTGLAAEVHVQEDPIGVAKQVVRGMWYLTKLALPTSVSTGVETVAQYTRFAGKIGINTVGNLAEQITDYRNQCEGERLAKSFVMVEDDGIPAVEQKLTWRQYFHSEYASRVRPAVDGAVNMGTSAATTMATVAGIGLAGRFFGLGGAAVASSFARMTSEEARDRLWTIGVVAPTRILGRPLSWMGLGYLRPIVTQVAVRATRYQVGRDACTWPFRKVVGLFRKAPQGPAFLLPV